MPLSVDTYHAEVARDAVGAGAHMVNDISGGSLDPEMHAQVRRRIRYSSQMAEPALLIVHPDTRRLRLPVQGCSVLQLPSPGKVSGTTWASTLGCAPGGGAGSAIHPDAHARRPSHHAVPRKHQLRGCLHRRWQGAPGRCRCSDELRHRALATHPGSWWVVLCKLTFEAYCMGMKLTSCICLSIHEQAGRKFGMMA